MSRYLYKKIQNISPESLNFQHSGLKLTTLGSDPMNDGKDTMSVRVPDGFLELHRSFKIHSKQFVYETLIGWGLNPEKTYSFKGEYLEEQKMVVFSLKNTD